MHGNGKLDNNLNQNIFSLPTHLQQTILALNKIRKGGASDIATGTNRARAVESNYLNQLTREKYLIKYRAGRKVIFEIRNKL